MNKSVLVFFAFVFCNALMWSQQLKPQAQYNMAIIGFWNVENLYDTLNDRWKNDEEFTPEGTNAWNGTRYRHKLNHLSEVIAQMGKEISPDGPAVLGLCEIENKFVVSDLIHQPALIARKYQLVHIEGPDFRGVDPSFIYNPKYFKVKQAHAIPVKLITDTAHRTRDILMVKGLFLNEPTVFFVNHWPSRRGGEMASRPNRNRAAQILRRVCDSLLQLEPELKIVIMGDFNDDPINESIKKGLITSGNYQSNTAHVYYNPMEQLYADGIGSLAYQDSWNLFDQIIINKPWIQPEFNNWGIYKARVFNKPFLKSDFGNFKGYPFRTYSGGSYTGGYSDHFPVYVIIAKKLN